MQTRKAQTTLNLFPGSTEIEPNADRTFKLTTTLVIKFNKSDDGDSFRCIIQPQSGRGNKVTKDRRIFVRCKRSCCARNTKKKRKLKISLLIFGFMVRGFLSAFPSMFLAISLSNLVSNWESHLSGCFRTLPEVQ